MSSVVVGNYSSHTCKHDDVAMIKAPLWATKREDLLLRYFFFVVVSVATVDEDS